jgi:hypothetical protein
MRYFPFFTFRIADDPSCFDRLSTVFSKKYEGRVYKRYAGERKEENLRLVTEQSLLGELRLPVVTLLVHFDALLVPYVAL